LHINSLISRGVRLANGQPAPGDTKERLIRLIKRATSELPWPELPGGTKDMFDAHLTLLSYVAEFGEPESAVEIFNAHVEEVERKVVAPNYAAKYYIYRLDWLLAAARKFVGDEGKRGAYVAEAKGLMERGIRSLRGMQLRDWSGHVRDSSSARLPDGVADGMASDDDDADVPAMRASS
jgi:hypothetical protein